MLRAGERFILHTAKTVEDAFYMAGRIIPSISWMKYAALRLGAFIMSYFSIVAAIAVGLTIAGVGIGVGLVLALVPVAVFIAIRISGALTDNRNSER